MALSGEPLHLRPAELERAGDGGQLRRWQHAAHQAIVGVDADREPGPQERPDRVLGHAVHGADLDVAGRRQLEVDLAVEHVTRQRAEAEPARRVGIG